MTRAKEKVGGGERIEAATLSTKKRKKQITDQNEDRDRRLMQREGRVDRLSNLPLDLRRHILSLLPFKDAVRTAVLSSVWRRTLPRLSPLILDDNTVPAFNNPCLLPCLEIPSLASITASLPRAVLRDLILGRGLQKLILGSPSLPLPHPHPLPSVPKFVLRSKSIRFLAVRFCRMPQPWVTCSLTNLITLKLKGVSIHDSLLCNIVSSCKFLSRLKLVLCEQLRLFNIHSPSLKHLVIRPLTGLIKIDFDAPSMKTLTLYTQQTVQTMVIRAPKLRRAFLHLAYPDHNCGIMVEQFLACSPELACLTLWGWSATLLDEFHRTSFRMLKSLFLTINIRLDMHMLVLLKLLESCPCLQKLNLSLVSNNGVPIVLMEEYVERIKRLPCLPNHLEQVVISGLMMWECERVLAELILHGAKAMKKMVLKLRMGCSDQAMADAKKLLSSRKGYIQESPAFQGFCSVQLNLQ